MSIDTDNVQRAKAGDIEIAYQTFGDPADPPVVLVMGLGTQMIGWQEEFCEALVDKRLFVVRFDNRDVGLSTHLSDVPAPDLMALMGGDHSSVAYTLSDMATDTVGMLDALGLDAVHLVGASMGGMIAQTLAIEHPARVRSLISIMSTTGNQSVGGPTEAALGVLLAPPATDRASAIERSVAAFRVIGSPGFPSDEAEIRARAERSFDRAFDPAGVGRQLGAVVASGDRTERLRSVTAPALVIHGSADPLVTVSGGEATAAAIPDAELLIVDGMGHDVPRGAWPQIVDAIAGHVQRAEAAGS